MNDFQLTYQEVRMIVKEVLRQFGKLETLITSEDAYKRYTCSYVQNLTKQGSLHPVKDESGNLFYNVAELEETINNKKR